jgi:hypothetical protein
MRRHDRGEGGQATVELVALLPVLAIVGMLVWQSVVAGQALWLAGAAARAAARAVAVGAEPLPAARRALPPSLEPGLVVERPAGGGVRVAIRVPAVLGGRHLTTVRAGAGFPAQS